MRVNLPALWAINEKIHIGYIKQLLSPEKIIICNIIQFTREKDVGLLLEDEQGNVVSFVFSKTPKAIYTRDESVIVCRSRPQDDFLDLKSGEWVANPLLNSNNTNLFARNALDSWSNAFRFEEENQTQNIIGFRKPQLGALHAIHAHWSVSKETATIVMPTGTGKTETMIGTILSYCCQRVLIIVPTDALRFQIADKFETLGFLKLPGSKILSETAQFPVVSTLTSRPRNITELEGVFSKSNVIITTSTLISGCGDDIQNKMAELCSHLFIDEAHHSEAPTWKTFRQRFNSQIVIQFTATPFREDGQKIDGKLIYIYPLKMAQQDGYFRPIRFRPVNQYIVENGDMDIALAALDELDNDISGKHIVMARVADTNRAQQIHALYQSLDRYQSVIIHSKINASEREIAKQQLFSGQARVVVCVDMLGEGFDLPELKIAAFHDIRKSLAVTLQLAGRFTRARADLGDPVFIANTALIDVSDELRTLYSQDPDWNVLLPQISQSVIDNEIISQEFFNGFNDFIDEVPLKELRPAASMVVYKTNCSQWTPEKFKLGFHGLTTRDKLYHTVNTAEKTLVVLAATEQGVRWSDVESIRELGWELFIAIWDSDLELLYLHGSSINGSYKDIAKAICGTDVELVVAPNIFRCFHGINRLILNNVGLNEFLGRQVRYTGRMGSDVESRIGQAIRQGSSRAVLAGQGYENGDKASVGAAKKGRVWSNLRLKVDSFSIWAKRIGQKLANDNLNPDDVLAGTLKPNLIGMIPCKTITAVEWPEELYMRTEHSVFFHISQVNELALTYVDLGIMSRGDSDPIIIKVYSDNWECHFRLNLIAAANSFDFNFDQVTGPELRIRIGQSILTLAEFFTDHPPSIWYADGSCLEGSQYTELPTIDIRPYDKSRLITFDWSGIDITKESQRETKDPNTIQHKLIQHLQNDPSYEIIFDDDGSGEAADVVTVRVVTENEQNFIDVELYHCKYAGGQPGARIDDLYIVCGQAQRSTTWLINQNRRTELFTHLLRREDLRISQSRSTRFERGGSSVLTRIRDMSRRCDVRLKVCIVQPGVSSLVVSNSQLLLLAVTERYLTDTYQIPLQVICST